LWRFRGAEVLAICKLGNLGNLGRPARRAAVGEPKKYRRDWTSAKT
jgi:hypothetical protein